VALHPRKSIMYPLMRKPGACSMSVGVWPVLYSQWANALRARRRRVATVISEGAGGHELVLRRRC
jgi:hypothetical protein